MTLLAPMFAEIPYLTVQVQKGTAIIEGTALTNPDRLIAMLEMGQSRPWPDALEAITGQRQMDAGAIVEYFAPLKKWLDEQNAGVPLGW